jgi:hypothetical protein
MGKKVKRKQSIPIPAVLAINICDTSIRDERTKKVTLVGLFNVIQATNFPCTHDQMHVYVAMTNGHGKYQTEIRFAHRKDNKVIAAMRGEVEFQSPLQVIEMVMEWRMVEFPEQGEYGVDVIFNGQIAISRKFHVISPAENSPTSGTEVQ